jgi:hypothetical protein
MRFLKFALIILITLLLTVITQVGGVVYILSLLSYQSIDRKVNNRLFKVGSKVLAFLALYLIFTFAIVPILAKPLGRIPLPIFENNHLKPANVLTCILNRHYVRPLLRDITFDVARKLNAQYPRASINYLDASFPFIDGFRLLPHISHSDGRKLDVSFQYNDKATGQITYEIPSFLGYGICEEPKPGEENMPAYCDRMGAWQYSLLQDIVSQENKDQFQFDNSRNRTMINLFAAQLPISRLYIEPHLKTRLGLTSAKIRFHGCRAVRHDDHLHVQIH